MSAIISTVLANGSNGFDHIRATYALAVGTVVVPCRSVEP